MMTKYDYDVFWDHLLETTGAMYWLRPGYMIACVEIKLRQYDEIK